MICRRCCSLISSIRRRKEAEEEVDADKEVDTEGEDNDKEQYNGEEYVENRKILVPQGGLTMTITKTTTTKAFLP